MNGKQGLDVTAVLRTVLYLLEQTDYPEKDGSAIASLKSCMHKAIAEIEVESRGRPN
ncbi:MAG: hypothetical protein WBF42_09350 [Terracidiphilus sp.]